MASLVNFDNLGRGWQVQRGLFQVVVGSSFGLYVDAAAAPRVWDDLTVIFGTHLHDCWPDRFPAVEADAMDYIAFDSYPRDERKVLLAAVERFLGDLRRNEVDPHVDWNPDRREIVIEATERIVALMKDSLAQPDLPHSEAKT
jgi:hypothetical protein